jgi:hypothetical protein
VCSSDLINVPSVYVIGFLTTVPDVRLGANLFPVKMENFPFADPRAREPVRQCTLHRRDSTRQHFTITTEAFLRAWGVLA